MERELFEKQYHEYADDILYADQYCLTTDDIKKIIDFFESAGDYEDSQRLLSLAKYEFCRKISTFDESLVALKYLDQIADELDIDKPKFQEAILDLGTMLRVKELYAENITIMFSEEVSFDSILLLSEDLLKASQKDNESLNKFDKELARRTKQEAVSHINKNIGWVIDDADNADELSELLENLRQLGKIYPELNSEGIFNLIEQRVLVLQEEKRISHEELLKIQAKEKIKKRNSLFIKIGIVILALAVGVLFILNKINGYSAKNVKMSVISKTNIDYNEDLADGNINAGYFYDFNFAIENSSPNEIETIKGVMQITNSGGKTLASTSVEFQGEFKEESIEKVNLSLNLSKGKEARELWDTDLEDLRVTFKIKAIYFADGTNKVYNDAEKMVIHDFE